MAFWNKTKDVPREMAGGEPLDPVGFLQLIERLGRACADEVGRLGGDSDQVMATLGFDDVQRVSRQQLASDGRPMLTGKKFLAELNEIAAPLVNQPKGRHLATVDYTVADGKLDHVITYRD